MSVRILILSFWQIMQVSWSKASAVGVSKSQQNMVQKDTSEQNNNFLSNESEYIFFCRFQCSRTFEEMFLLLQ